MFVCKECLSQDQWESTMFRSFGKCEICDKNASCADIPSKYVVLKSEEVKSE